MDCSRDMAKLFREYDQLKGIDNASRRFWDAVVFSVNDKEQKSALDFQLSYLRAQKQIPLVDYEVVPDVADYKMGSGGATMHILSELLELWGDSLYSKRILLIHTGGQCRRLPQHSAMGKLFARLPQGTMLDLKLAMYLPFCARMKSGVFLAASDDIETYTIDGEFSIDPSGFTALAHPSSLEIAMHHGVYVLPQDQPMDRCLKSSSMRVLQKPTLAQIQEANAIIDEKFAYTDSAFVFGPDVMKCLLQFYAENRPLNREICAYGDFLTCLGRDPPPTEDPLKIRLREFPLSIIVLPKSNFYHIGTLSEYLDLFCWNIPFKSQLNLGSEFKINIHSSLPENVTAGGCYVVEFCDFSSVSRLTIGDQSVVHGCQSTCADLVIPSSLVVFTVPVKGDLFVTAAFGINDDLKTSHRLLGDYDVGGCLWNAKLFSARKSRDESLQATLRDLQALRDCGIVQDASRYSIEDFLREKSIDSMLEYQRCLINGS